MKKLTPKSRTENIVVQNLQGEILLYDLKINKAFCLNETAALVYEHCDGKTSFDELRLKSGKNVSDEVIWLAIEELSKLNLLAEKAESGLSRRSLLQKAAVSAIALPLVTMLVAPRAIQAASGSCTPDEEPTENPQSISSADIDTCLGAGYPDASCCSETAYGEYFFGDCFTVTCGSGPGCVSPGGAPDRQYLGSSNDIESCPNRTDECCSGVTSYNTFPGPPPSYDCYCGPIPPQ